jgi:DNA invertase Pin-like site-specific DNA recombinase
VTQAKDYKAAVTGAIYARVSTTANQSVEMQLWDLRELAARRGLEIVKEYCDEGVSGAKKSRPALDKMLADGRPGRFDAILVWKLDRLGRSLLHLVRLLEEFRCIGIELVSFSEGLDFTTTTGSCSFKSSVPLQMMRSARLCKATAPKRRCGLHISDVGLRIIPGRTAKRSARSII